MITYPLVKEVIKLPSVFLLIFIIVLVIFAFFNLLASLISSYSDFSQINAGIFFSTLVYSIFMVLPGVLILSLLLVLIRLSLKPAAGLPAVLVLFCTVCIVFTGSLLGSGQLVPAGHMPVLPPHYFTKAQFREAGPLFIYPGNVDKNGLQDVLVFNSESPGYKFSYYKQLPSSLNADTVTITIANKKVNAKLKNSYTRFLYEYDQFSGDILQAYGVFDSDLLKYAQKPGFLFFFTCSAFIFFLIACGMFTRITRWPLFNLLLFSVIITLFIVLYGFYKTELYDELAGAMKESSLLDYIPAFIMAGIGILFILVDIIFIPRKTWKEGI